MSRCSRARVAGTLGAVLVGSAACGVPTGSAPTTIAPADVPYGLAAPASPPSAAPSSVPRDEAGWAYLVGPDEALLPRARDTGTGSPAERLEELLSGLAAGPTEEEQAQGLSTALPQGLELSVTGIDAATATIDLSGAATLPSGEDSRRAVAQLVLTATSLPGVEAVLLTSDGKPVEAPLPSGELTDLPLSPADYGVFLSPPTPPVTTPPPPAGAASPSSAVPSPFSADTGPDTAQPSPGAAVTVTDVRAGRHEGFDRVVFAVGGSGLPGWDARYVPEARAAGSGFPVGVAGGGLLQLTLTGLGLPGDTGVAPYAAPGPVLAGSGAVREVVLDGMFEGQMAAFLGTTAERPFRVYRLSNPTRVVVEVLHQG